MGPVGAALGIAIISFKPPYIDISSDNLVNVSAGSMTYTFQNGEITGIPIDIIHSGLIPCSITYCSEPILLTGFGSSLCPPYPDCTMCYDSLVYGRCTSPSIYMATNVLIIAALFVLIAISFCLLQPLCAVVTPAVGITVWSGKKIASVLMVVAAYMTPTAKAQVCLQTIDLIWYEKDTYNQYATFQGCFQTTTGEGNTIKVCTSFDSLSYIAEPLFDFSTYETFSYALKHDQWDHNGGTDIIAFLQSQQTSRFPTIPTVATSTTFPQLFNYDNHQSVAVGAFPGSATSLTSQTVSWAGDQSTLLVQSSGTMFNVKQRYDAAFACVYFNNVLLETLQFYDGVPLIVTGFDPGVTLNITYNTSTIGEFDNILDYSVMVLNDNTGSPTTTSYYGTVSNNPVNSPWCKRESSETRKNSMVVEYCNDLFTLGVLSEHVRSIDWYSTYVPTDVGGGPMPNFAYYDSNDWNPSNLYPLIHPKRAVYWSIELDGQGYLQFSSGNDGSGTGDDFELSVIANTCSYAYTTDDDVLRCVARYVMLSLCVDVYKFGYTVLGSFCMIAASTDDPLLVDLGGVTSQTPLEPGTTLPSYYACTGVFTRSNEGYTAPYTVPLGPIRGAVVNDVPILPTCNRYSLNLLAVYWFERNIKYTPDGMPDMDPGYPNYKSMTEALDAVGMCVSKCYSQPVIWQIKEDDPYVMYTNGYTNDAQLAPIGCTLNYANLEWIGQPACGTWPRTKWASQSGIPESVTSDTVMAPSAIPNVPASCISIWNGQVIPCSSAWATQVANERVGKDRYYTYATVKMADFWPQPMPFTTLGGGRILMKDFNENAITASITINYASLNPVRMLTGGVPGDSPGNATNSTSDCPLSMSCGDLSGSGLDMFQQMMVVLPPGPSSGYMIINTDIGPQCNLLNGGNLLIHTNGTLRYVEVIAWCSVTPFTMSISNTGGSCTSSLSVSCDGTIPSHNAKPGQGGGDDNNYPPGLTGSQWLTVIIFILLIIISISLCCCLCRCNSR